MDRRGRQAGDPVTAYFERYAAAIDAFDAEAITAFFQVPCTMVNNDYAAHLMTPEAVLSNMRAICAYHTREGYGRARPTDVRVRETSPQVRLAEVDWEVDDREGQPLWRFTNTYQLTKYEDDWRILVSTTHADA